MLVQQGRGVLPSLPLPREEPGLIPPVAVEESVQAPWAPASPSGQRSLGACSCWQAALCWRFLFIMLLLGVLCSWWLLELLVAPWASHSLGHLRSIWPGWHRETRLGVLFGKVSSSKSLIFPKSSGPGARGRLPPWLGAGCELCAWLPSSLSCSFTSPCGATGTSGSTAPSELTACQSLFGTNLLALLLQILAVLGLSFSLTSGWGCSCRAGVGTVPITCSGRALFLQSRSRRSATFPDPVRGKMG